MKASTVTRGFRKAEIQPGIGQADDPELSSDSESDASGGDEIRDEAAYQLFISDTEVSDFSGFSAASDSSDHE